MRGTRARARVRHSDHTRMDALAALLSERPQQQLSATELRSRIALLEAAARACHAELESRTSRLDALPDEIQQVIFALLCNALDPRSAVAYSSASKGLREPMQRVGEGAGKSLLQQLKEENEAAAALCLKAGVQSCKALREAKEVGWRVKGLSATHLAMLGKLTPVLPALETLSLYEESGSAGPGPAGVGPSSSSELFRSISRPSVTRRARQAVDSADEKFGRNMRTRRRASVLSVSIGTGRGRPI